MPHVFTIFNTKSKLYRHEQEQQSRGQREAIFRQTPANFRQMRFCAQNFSFAHKFSKNADFKPQIWCFGKKIFRQAEI